MATKIAFKIVSTLLMVAFLGVLIYLFETYLETERYFYSIPVDVQAGDEIVSASSTREIVFHKNMIQLPEMGSWSSTQKGEAVIIPLPNGQTVFALLPRSSGDDLLAAFGRADVAGIRKAYQRRTVGYITPRIIATNPAGYPDFVRFRSLLNPSSVETLDPKDLSPGSEMKSHVSSIKVYFSGGPINKSIKRYLPWIGTIQDSFSPPTSPYCPCQFETGS